MLTYTEFRKFSKRAKRIERKLDQVLINQGVIMATGAQVLQNLQDTKALVQQLYDAFIERDQITTQLKADLAAAVSRADMSDAAKAQLQADMDAVFQGSEDLENDTRAKVPGLPPVGGTPLVPTYADKASFDAAVLAYAGPERVTFTDASSTVDAKAGTDPSIDYFLHSADGSVSTSGPTD